MGDRSPRLTLHVTYDLKVKQHNIRGAVLGSESDAVKQVYVGTGGRFVN